MGVVRRKKRKSRDPRFGPRSGAGGETRRSTNADLDWKQVPGCGLGGVTDEILRRILALRRAKVGINTRILI